MRRFTKVIQYSLVLQLLPVLTAAQSGEPRSGEIRNPLNFNSDEEGNGIAQLLVAIVDIISIVAVPVIVFFIIYSGFLYVTARGNEETLGQAKKSLLYAVIGGVIIVGANLIGAIVLDTAQQFSGSSED